MFTVDKNTSFIIYGASYIGSVTGKELQKQGNKILYFVDKRAEEIKECIGVTVISLDELSKLNQRDAVIFVAVKNVYYHEEIVEELNEIGYEKVIYKTANAISGEMSTEECVLDSVYEGMYKKGLSSSCEVPIILSKSKAEFPQVALIREEEKDVIVRMPVELVYTGVTDEQWTDVPILAAVPYWQLFRFFEGMPGYTPDNYIELCKKGAENEGLKITDGWKQYVLSNRYSIYENMRWRLEFTPEYFIDNAPKATFNSKGYFNLQTGKHRISFLVALGYGTVAIRVDKKEWEAFYNNEEKEQLEKYLINFPRKKQPIIHPYFMGNLNYCTRETRKDLMDVMEKWYKEGVVRGNYRTKEKVVCDLQRDEYYEEFFNKMGIQLEYRS